MHSFSTATELQGETQTENGFRSFYTHQEGTQEERQIPSSLIIRQTFVSTGTRLKQRRLEDEVEPGENLGNDEDDETFLDHLHQHSSEKKDGS